MLLPTIKDAHELSGLLVDLALLVGAIFAVIKFRLFNILGHRWRSDLACNHYVLPDSSIVFTGDYTIHNTGQRPLLLDSVTIRLTAARSDASLLVPDDTQIFATRVFQSGEPALKGLFQIEPGERTIFPIRAHLPKLDDCVFVLCEFSLRQKRVPGAYKGFYVKSRPAQIQLADQPEGSSAKSPLDEVTDSIGS